MPVMEPSIGSSSPPISKLTNDILLFIFSINADMTDESLWCWDDNKLPYRALHVTRHTSQVSRYWRTLILESPTIWARVIDIELFRPSLESWREEVFRRCGRCLLSVKGLASFERDLSTSVITDKDALVKFFDTYWDQIKNFHVKVTYSNLVDDETWSRILCRPARFLCSFNLQLQYYDDDNPSAIHQLFPSPDATPFSNVAPALHRFYHDPMTSISALRVPWLSQLRVLELNFTWTQRPRATTIQVLDLLENLHVLEVLKISAGYFSLSSSTDKPLHPIKLPRLHRLGIDCTSLDDCIYFLDHITPHQKCTLSLYSKGLIHFQLFEPPDEKSGEKVASLAEHFSMYAKCLDWHNTQVLSLGVSSNSLEFTTYGESWKDNSSFLDASDNFFIKLKVEIANSGSRDGVDFLPFLCSIPSSLLGFVKVFDLDFPHDNCFTHAPRPEFHDFLASFLSVETLIASNHTLSLLLKCFSTSAICFPSLHTLQMRQLENHRVPTIHDSIMDFLRRRREGARVIEVLDLTLAHDAYEHEFGFLEEMTGLKVRWGFLDEPVHEYVCGTGSPEVLDLAKCFYEGGRDI